MAIVKSIIMQSGHSLVVMFPRQSGKNELQAQIEAYLLFLYKEYDTEMVKISPTWKPQSLNAMRRLERVLNRNLATRGNWVKESGYIYRLGQARIFFLSGSPEANIVGATANLLLQVDEAQDIQIAKFDKDIAPMAASSNATRVFWGTAWTSRTLLARELRLARQAEQADGIRRAFVIDADSVAREVPVYGKFVADQVNRLGRSHPSVRTQYFAEEIDSEGGMFPPVRLALMQGNHAPLDTPLPGRVYAALLDLAGEDEAAANTGDALSDLQNPHRDLTALTIVECDLQTLQDDLLQAPTYLVVQRSQWAGTKHSQLYGQLRALLLHWKVRYAVVDATGVGAGMASFLAKSLGERVITFTFTSSSKSQLGWDFLSICDMGRWKEPARSCDAETGRHGDAERISCGGANKSKGNEPLLQQSTRSHSPWQGDLQEVFWRQCEMCEFQVLDGPGKLMRWGVPDGKRDPATGETLHDDLLVSAAFSAVLDRQSWGLTAPAAILHARDVLEELDEGF